MMKVTMLISDEDYAAMTKHFARGQVGRPLVGVVEVIDAKKIRIKAEDVASMLVEVGQYDKATVDDVRALVRYYNGGRTSREWDRLDPHHSWLTDVLARRFGTDEKLDEAVRNHRKTGEWR